ncbi:hypothetical protein glysoja_011218 [Glycine soja]|nr:hypothetical protein glysoja_011218 [Glycine soja]
MQYSNMKEGDNVSRQWEQRNNFHVSCLANDNGGTIFSPPSTHLVIPNGGTPISRYSEWRHTYLANPVKMRPPLF